MARKLERRNLGRTGMTPCVLGLGGAGFGSTKSSDRDTVEGVRRAIETGQIEIVLTYLDYTLLDQSVARTTLPLARQRGVGIILASVFGMGLLGGREPDLKSPRPKGYLAHAMWQWCRDHGVDIHHLAMQFCLAAPIDGPVMPGPCNQRQVEEAYEAATAEIAPEIWGAFKAEFGVGV